MRALMIFFLASCLLCFAGSPNYFRILPSNDFYWGAINQTMEAIVQQILIYRKAVFSNCADCDDSYYQNSLVLHVNALRSCFDIRCLQLNYEVPEAFANISVALQSYDINTFDINTADLSIVVNSVYPIIRKSLDAISYCASQIVNWDGADLYNNVNQNLNPSTILNELQFLKNTNSYNANYFLKSVLQSMKSGFYSGMGEQIVKFYYSFYPLPDPFKTFWSNAINNFLNSAKNVIIAARSSIYLNVLPKESTIEQMISSEMDKTNNCLNNNIIFLHMIENLYHQYINSNQFLYWENTDSTRCSNIGFKIYQTVLEFKDIASTCLASTSIIGPYVSNLIVQMTYPKISDALCAQQQNSGIINNNFQELMLGMFSKKFNEIGDHMARLYFIFKRLHSPPSNTLLFQFFQQAWLGAFNALKEARTLVYGNDTTELQTQENLKEDLNEIYTCLYPDSKIIQIIFYLIYTFSDFNAISFDFSYANLATLSNDLNYYIHEGYNDISQCLSSSLSVGSYLGNLIPNLNEPTILSKLQSLSPLSSNITTLGINLINSVKTSNYAKCWSIPDSIISTCLSSSLYSLSH